MKIGIFGGTFNPIHIGHMHIADSAARTLALDKVLFVPSKVPYTKLNNELESYYCRRSMVNMAIHCDDRFFVGDDGCKTNERTYTYITVQYYRNMYPNDKLYLIVGEDAYADISTWKNYLEIFRNIDGIYVYRRGKNPRSLSELRNMHPSQNVYVNDNEDVVDISSTDIRNRLMRGLSCKYLLPLNVYEYILNHKLYKDWEGMR